MISSQQTAIILRKAAYGEADEIVTALLSGGGVRRFFATGTRKSRRRFGGLVDHFARLTLNYQPRSAGLWRLLSVEEASVVLSPWRDPCTFALGHVLAELICIFIPEEVPTEELYALWGEIESSLTAAPVSALSAASILLRCLPHFGYAVDLSHCRFCGVLTDDMPCLFDKSSGGLFCHTCMQPLKSGQGGVALSSALRRILLTDMVSVSATERAALEPLAIIFVGELIRFCELHAQCPIRSAAFLLKLLGAAVS